MLLGGDRQGSILAPAVIADVDPSSPVSKDELFGPAVAVNTVTSWDEAIALANDTIYGLSVGVFTSDLAGAVRAIREIDSGNVHVNWTPLWRADLMPYGGLKASGIGKGGTSAGRLRDDRGEDHRAARPTLVGPLVIKVLVEITRFAATADRGAMWEMVARLEDAGATGVSVPDHFSSRWTGVLVATGFPPAVTRLPRSPPSSACPNASRSRPWS